MAGVVMREANLRDASFVLANLRPLDYQELSCQTRPGTPLSDIAAYLVMGNDAFVAHVDGTPAAVFGTSDMGGAARSIWALGTKRMWRAVPAITDFVVEDIVPALLGDGYHMLEARSLSTHHLAHNWMLGAGAEQVGPPFPYGRNREMFLLFRWTAASLGRIKRKSRKTR